MTIEEEKRRIFEEMIRDRGFQGISRKGNVLIVYWDCEKNIQPIESKFEIIDEVIGEIKPFYA